MKITKLLMTLFLASSWAGLARSACGDGTLACHTTGDNADTPILCDVTNHFVMSTDAKSCEKKKVDGCEIAAFDAATEPCLVCEAGKVFDAENKKCVAVATDKTVENCDRYKATDSTCNRCNDDHYMSVADSKCVAVETKVANCASYSDKTTCEMCMPDYYQKDTKCEPVPKVENCFKVTDRVCDMCEADYSMNRGWNFDMPVNAGVLGHLQGGAMKFNQLNVANNEASVCQKQILTNCSVYEAYNACKTCSMDYFVNTTKKCERNPEKAILNCAKYMNNTTCSQCKENFYVSGSPTTCKAVTAVTDCATYQIDLDKCKTCADGFYLNESLNTCVERTKKTIANCTVLDPKSDACKTCEADFTGTTPNGEKCLANVPDCKVSGLVNGGDSGTEHTCNDCKDSTFYIDAGLCKARTVTNCQVYNGSTNNCTTCNTDHWLDAAECKVSSVAQCAVYTSNVNECTDCEPNHTRASATSCTVNTIAECTKYAKNTNNCEECAAGKFVVGNACVVPSVDNCQVMEVGTDKCETCSTGYFRHTDGTCSVQALTNCVDHALNKDECKMCSLGHHLDGTTCSLNTQKNCASYAPNLDQCASCSKGYYFNSNTCTQQNVAGCIEYVGNNNTCSKCQMGKWLNSATCDDVNVTQCIAYTDNTNNCTKCSAGFYISGTGSSATCAQRTKTNCTSYDVDSDTCNTCGFGFEISSGSCVAKANLNCVTMNASYQCTKCESGYYLDSDVCTINTVVANCMTYNTTADSCAVCNDGHYTTDSGATCPAKDQNNCLTYTASKAENKCEGCNPISLTYVNPTTGACDDITTPADCYASYGDTQNKCKQCMPGKYISSDFCTGSSTAANFDSNCVGTKATDAGTRCSTCDANFSVADGILSETADNSSNNCYQTHSTTGLCDQCLPGYELQPDKSCTLYSGTAGEDLCNQHSAGDEKSLTVTTACDVCKYSSLTFLNSNDCKFRDEYSNMKHCSVYDPTSKECLACDENTVADTDFPVWGCTADANAGTNNNCAVFGDTGKCKICNRGFVINGDNCVIGESDQHIAAAYDAELSPAVTFNVDAGRVITNCVKYSQIRDGVSMCTKCDSLYTAIINNNYDSTTVKDFGYVVGGEGLGLMDDIQNGFEICLDTTIMLRKDTVNSNNAGACLLGFTVEGNANEYACMQCVGGKIGDIDQVNQLANNTPLAGPHYSLFGCDNQVAGNIGARLYSFMGDHKMDTDGYLARRNANFAYDSCVADDATGTRLTDFHLIYMMYPDANGFMTYVSKKHSTASGNLKQFYCVGTATIDDGQNCAFWIMKADIVEAEIDPATYDFAGLTHCGACMPGYKPTYTGLNITQCTQMATTDHDETPANNTWMNRAQTPSHGGWVWDVANKMIDYSTPLTSAEAKPNCLAYDTTNSKCVFCEHGWTVTKGVCTLANYPGATCKGVYGMTNFQLETTDLGNMNQMSNMLVLRTSVDNTGDFNLISTVSPYCSVCGTGFSPHQDIVLTYRKCESKPLTGEAADCKYLDITDKTKCYLCKNTHTKNVADDTCGIKVANCEIHNAGDCVKCDSGFVLDGTTCVVPNCKEWDPTTPTDCLVCDDNKALDGVKKTHCGSGAPVDTDCLNMSPVLGFCVKSKASGKIPYNIMETTGSGTTVRATEHIVYDTTGNGYANIRNEYLYVNVDYVPAIPAVMSGLVAVNTQAYNNASFTKVTGNEPADKFCLPSRTLTNCTAGHDGLYCRQCDGKFEANNKGLCVTGTVASCAKYTGATCSECEATHFLNSSGSGSGICLSNVRSKSDGAKCATQKIDADECLTCAAGKYLDGTSKECIVNDRTDCLKKSITDNTCEECYWNKFSGTAGCVEFTANNCKTRHATDLQCDTCAQGYTFNGGVTCIVNTALLCNDWHATDNKCADCSTSYQLATTGASDGSCVKKTASLCRTYSTTANECDACSSGFKRTVSDCSWGSAENCATFNPTNADLCATCSPMYYMNGTSCDIRSPEGCKTFSSTQSENLCGDCADSFWKDTTTCSRPTEKHCQVTKGSTDGCHTCLGGFDVNGSFTCDKRSVDTCLTYTNDNKCASCLVGKYINGAGACLSNTAENCGDKSITVNECETCAVGFWKDTADANLCKANTAENCLIKSLVANECSTCAANFWKDSADNNLCKANDALNCKSKNMTANACQECNDQHWMDAADSEKCKAHTALNCLTFNLYSDDCKTCKVGMLEGTSGSKKTCTVYATPDCLTFSNIKDECATCVTATNFKHNNGSKNLCSERTHTNCATFNASEDTCLTCSQQTYLKTGKCETNTVVDQCKTYSTVADACSVCNDGFYKSASKNECWLYPDGIEGCVAYSSRTECTHCDDKTFLASNKCGAVTTPVSHCLVYSSATECKTCIPGKYLVANKCEPVTATNCLELADKDTCKSCQHPYVFNTTSKKCEASGITDCAQGVFATAGNTCAKCGLGKVLSDDKKTCVSPTTTVANCSHYASLTKCHACAAGFIMSLDGTKCDAISSTAGANCSIASTVSDYVCDLCRFGFKKDKDGKCVENGVMHCLIPSADGKTCSLCMPSSYMMKDGKCTKPGSNEPTASTLIWGSLFTALLSLLVL